MKLHLIPFAFLIACGTSKPEVPDLTYADAMAGCLQERAKVMEENNLEEGDFIMPFLFSHDCLIGAALPEFSGTTLSNKVIDRKYLRDKVNVINFWFKECAPCVAEIPGFQILTQQFKGQDVNFLALGLDSKEEVETFLTDREWDFDHLYESRSIIKEDFQLLWGYPFTIITNKKGEIIKIISGGAIDASATDRIIDEIAPVVSAELKINS